MRVANPPKAKGTAFENEVLERVRRIWPDADRAKAGNESHDIVGAGGYVIECKHRRAWALFSWVPKVRRVALSKGAPWIIVAAHGDRRSSPGREVGTVAIVDWHWLAGVLEHLEGQP